MIPHPDRGFHCSCSHGLCRLSDLHVARGRYSYAGVDASGFRAGHSRHLRLGAGRVDQCGSAWSLHHSRWEDGSSGGTDTDRNSAAESPGAPLPDSFEFGLSFQRHRPVGDANLLVLEPHQQVHATRTLMLLG